MCVYVCRYMHMSIWECVSVYRCADVFFCLSLSAWVWMCRGHAGMHLGVDGCVRRMCMGI